MKHLLNLLLVVTLCNSAVAQKLPNKQEASLLAPANIKIDGNADEWDGKFQAFNKATEVYYTICNDNQKLYLVIQSREKDVTNKILMGGITLKISTKERDKQPIMVTYPLLTSNDLGSASNTLLRETRNARDSVASPSNINRVFATGAKEIEVKGIPTISDENISIYNQEGIQARGFFTSEDKKIIYTYELALPLKYLGNGTTFNYNIKLNEPRPVAMTGPLTGPPPPPVMTTSIATTDFSGEYTLAK